MLHSMAGITGIDLKLAEIELPSNVACKETLNRLLSQNALWSVKTVLFPNEFDVFPAGLHFKSLTIQWSAMSNAFLK